MRCQPGPAGLPRGLAGSSAREQQPRQSTAAVQPPAQIQGGGARALGGEAGRWTAVPGPHPPPPELGGTAGREAGGAGTLHVARWPRVPRVRWGEGPRPACSAQPCVVTRQVHGVRHPAPRPLPSTCQCRALPSRLLEPHDWAAVGGEVASTLPGAVSSLRSAVGRGPQVALPSRLDPDHKLPSHTGGPWPLGRAGASRPRASAPGPPPGSMHHRAPVRGPGRGPVLGGWTGTLWTSLRGPLTAKVVCVRSGSRSRRRGRWEGPSARREIQPRGAGAGRAAGTAGRASWEGFLSRCSG